MNLKHTRLTSPILGYTFWRLKHTPAVRLSLLSSLERRALHREKMETEGQQPLYHLMNLERKQPELSSMTSASQVSSASKSKPTSLHLLPHWKGQERVQYGAESNDCGDRGPPSSALPSMMQSHVKGQVCNPPGFRSTQDS